MGVAYGAFGAAIASRGAPHPVAAGAVALGFAAVGGLHGARLGEDTVYLLKELGL